MNVVFIILGLVGVAAACSLHSRVAKTMRKSTFVFALLMSAGTLPVGYTLIWVIADQSPVDFSLRPIFDFGLTMVVIALIYGALVVLYRISTRKKKGIAPSK